MRKNSLPHHLAALWFADIAGYTLKSPPKLVARTICGSVFILAMLLWTQMEI